MQLPAKTHYATDISLPLPLSLSSLYFIVHHILLDRRFNFVSPCLSSSELPHAIRLMKLLKYLKYMQMGSGMGQLVERSLPTIEVRCSNLVIGKIYIERLLSTILKRRK